MEARDGLCRDCCVAVAWLACVAFAVTGGVGGLIVMLHLTG
jgi:hypothetical protein